MDLLDDDLQDALVLSADEEKQRKEWEAFFLKKGTELLGYPAQATVGDGWCFFRCVGLACGAPIAGLQDLQCIALGFPFNHGAHARP